MSILQDLLNLGLLEIGSDDSRFEKMQSAASVLTKRLKEEPALLIPATFVTLDENVDEDAPIYILVEDIVIAEWKTLRNTHTNRPRQLLRSILIEALASASDGNAEASGVVWNTAAALLRHKQVQPGKAGNVVETIVRQACNTAELEAISRAGMAEQPSKKRKQEKATINELVLEFDSEIEEDEIVADVARSAGPQFTPVPGDLDDPNPHWPTSAQPWSNEFTPRMAAALVKAVNLGTARLSEGLSENLTDYIGALEKRLLDQLRDAEKLQNELMQQHLSSRMRLEVLWWSESLYSPTLRGGYRDFPLPIAVVAAAIDLSKIVPALAPASVCYVLGETVLHLCRVVDVKKKQRLISYLQGLTSSARPEIEVLLPRPMLDGGRLPLIDIVGEACTGADITAEALRSRAGIDAMLELSPAEFAMWIFRDLQARRLIEELR